MSAGAEVARARGGDGTWSLRRRIVLLVISVAIAVWTILGLISWRVVVQNSALEFDEHLHQQALAVLSYADHEFIESGGRATTPELGNDPVRPADLAYQVWTREGQLIHRSPGAPFEPIVASAEEGYHDVRLGKAEWRALRLPSAYTPLVLQIAEPVAHREVIAVRSGRALVLPMTLALALLAVMVWWVVGEAFAPVRALAEALDRRSPADMAPLEPRDMPTETAALGRAVNALVERHAELVRRERRFASDAAHELRTPLAGLRARAQVALRARSWPEAKESLASLISSVDRTTRLAVQLLDLARVEPGEDAGRRPVDVSGLARHVCNELGPVATQSGVRLECVLDEATVLGEETGIAALLRNLVENALGHAPTGGRVRVSIAALDGQAILLVEDSGPGIPPGERERVFDRFYRVPGTVRPGSGLGLSIVSRVAARHGAKLALERSELGGLLVEVRFEFAPPPTSAPPG